jgi:membrane-bound metal-dependent hydrolase YbcI (DUF457 family)
VVRKPELFRKVFDIGRFRYSVDPFSHYIVAYAAGRRANLSINKMRAITLGGVIPDIDGFSLVLGFEAFRDIHGGVVHSFLAGVILASIITLGFYLYSKENVAQWAFAGVFLHFILDIPNTLGYVEVWEGLQYFWPFSDYKIALQNYVPNAEIWHIVIITIVFGLCMFYFLYLAKKGVFAWRIWMDERRFFKKKTEEAERD